MKKAALVVGVLVLVAIAFLIAFGDQMLQTLVTKRTFASESVLTMVPTPLDIDIHEASATATSLTNFGYTVDVPWGEITFSNAMRNLAMTQFQAGTQIACLNPEGWPDMLDDIEQSTNEGSDELRELFQGYGHREFHEEFLNVQPSQFRILMGKQSCNRLKALLELKGILLSRFSRTYRFELDNLGGYQLGEPGEDNLCYLAVFHEDDHPYEFLISTKEGEEQNLTQADLNLIISSFKLSK